MDFFSAFCFDNLAASFIVCLILREVMILVLPDHIAGPGGRLIDTGAEEV